MSFYFINTVVAKQIILIPFLETTARMKASSSRTNNNDAHQNQQPGEQPPSTTKDETVRPMKSRRRRMTNTNSDFECLPDHATLLQKIIYYMELHNGFKTFTLPERLVSYLIICLFGIGLAVSVFIFTKGVYDGIQCSKYSTMKQHNSILNHIVLPPQQPESVMENDIIRTTSSASAFTSSLVDDGIVQQAAETTAAAMDS